MKRYYTVTMKLLVETFDDAPENDIEEEIVGALDIDVASSLGNLTVIDTQLTLDYVK